MLTALWFYTTLQPQTVRVLLATNYTFLCTAGTSHLDKACEKECYGTQSNSKGQIATLSSTRPLVSQQTGSDQLQQSGTEAILSAV